MRRHLRIPFATGLGARRVPRRYRADRITAPENAAGRLATSGSAPRPVLPTNMTCRPKILYETEMALMPVEINRQRRSGSCDTMRTFHNQGPDRKRLVGAAVCSLTPKSRPAHPLVVVSHDTMNTIEIPSGPISDHHPAPAAISEAENRAPPQRLRQSVIAPERRLRPA